MLEIALRLFGAQFIKSRVAYLWIIGFLWLIVGVVIFIDGVDGKPIFPKNIFAYFLLFESILTLIVASNSQKRQKVILFFKGFIFLFCAFVIIANQKYSDVLLSAIFGFAYFITGVFVIASAWIIRFPKWPLILAFGALEIGFAFFLFLFQGATISFFLGVIMIGSGYQCLKIAFKAQHLNKNSYISELFSPTEFSFPFRKNKTRKNDGKEALHKDKKPLTQQRDFKHYKFKSSTLTVYIWTPEGSSRARAIHRPLISRYIAAVDINGVVSTGHSSLEVLPDLYISLYPADDIQRSFAEFRTLLKATPDNNVAGRFLPDYKTEVAESTPSNLQIHFSVFNHGALMAFWDAYKKNETYNLTYVNCSSSVAYALEAALDGVLSLKKHNFFTFLKLLLTPELWIAAQVRRRAIMMAWTPGLIMDYTLALHEIVQPSHIPWYKRLRIRRKQRKKKQLA